MTGGPTPRGPAAEAAALVRARRWASLGTIGPTGPSVSYVAYAPDISLEAVYLLLSGLAAHTRSLLVRPAAALGISEPDDDPDRDPQGLTRITLYGKALPLEPESPSFEAAWEVYTDRFPAAVGRIALPDFLLFRFEVASVRYVGGFARAATLRAEELRRAAV